MTKGQVLKGIGLVAVAVSLAFLAVELRGQIQQSQDFGYGWHDIGRLGVALPIYFVGLSCVHAAWGVMLAGSVHIATVPQAAAVSGRAQVAKYLPGNVAHVAGRQVLASRRGWSQQIAAGASLFEVVGLIVSAGLVLTIGATVGTGVVVERTRWSMAVLVVVTAAAAVAGVVVVKVQRFGELRRAVLASRRSVPKVIALYVAFFLLSGFAQVILLPQANHTRIVVAATAAWLAGFLAPGVPAGIGVREAVFVVSMGMSAAVIAPAVLGFRVVTIVADLLAFVVAVFIDRGVTRNATLPPTGD